MNRIYSTILSLFMFFGNAVMGLLGLESPRQAFFVDTESKIANTRMDQILEFIKLKDKNALKKLFSKSALDSSKNIDKYINELFEFFKGDFISYDNWGGPGTDEHSKYGTCTWKKIWSTYNIETSEEKYQVSIKETLIDIDHPENVGVLSICIINMKDKEEDYDFAYGGIETTGVFIDRKKDKTN